MSAATSTWLRPSMLPKLALCGRYRPNEDAGDAAARGTKLDEAFRAAIAGNAAPFGDLASEDQKAVTWAVDTSKALAGGKELLSGEDALRVEVYGMKGTADLLCAAHWSADLKTGQKRNYLEQQAAYALGFMDSLFLDEWTVYLLYCDQEEVETLRFTREEAEKAVRGALAKANSDEPPQPNDYCGWCANRFTCSARREQVGIGELDGPNAWVLDQLPSDTLRNFVLRAKVVEDFSEKARELLKDRTLKGEKTAGVSLVSKRGSRQVPHTVIELHLKELGTGDVLAAYGNMSETKLLEIWNRKLPGKPFPADQVQEMPGSSYVRVSQPKGAK